MTLTRFIPAIGWFFLSLVLFCLPGSALPKNPLLVALHADKLAHIILFFILCFLFARPFRNTGLGQESRRQWFLFIMLTGVLYGISIEFVQKYWIPNRSFEIGDIVADGTGCFLAWWNNKRKFLRG